MRRSLELAILLILAAPATASAATAVVTETVNDVGGRFPTLTYSALPGERNQITMTRGSGPGVTFGQVTIRDDGAAIEPGAGCTAIGVHTVQCRQQPYVLNGVELVLTPRVFIDAGDGDDAVTTVPSYADYDLYVLGGDGADALTGAGHLAGGAGNDVLQSMSRPPEPCYKGCGDPPPVVLAGGTGDDVLRGGPGIDVFIGDGDSETSADPGGGNDVMDGGPGGDSVVYAGRTTPVRVDLTGALPSGTPGEGDRLAGIESVTGGQAPDVLLGDDAPNSLNGGPGDDTLDGAGANDNLNGGLGSDTLLGRAGNDELSGEQAGDALYGGPGDDRLSNRSGDGSLFAGVLHCGSGRDVVYTPQGPLLIGCEQIQLNALNVLPQRRLRDGRLRSVLRCGSGLRCEFVFKVRRGSTVLARRSLTVPVGRTRTIDVPPRARVRAGQTIEVTIAGRVVVSDRPSGPFTVGSLPISGRWRMRL